MLTINTVLHPYYKLDYIKMAWGGPEEQAQELAAGNQNAMNWYDTALQIVEKTMQEYWSETEHDAEAKSKVKFNNTMPTVGMHPTPVDMLESEYDHHRHMLIEQVTCNTTMGWATELQRYLTELMDNVSKDMDIVSWWLVSCFIFASLWFTK